MESGNFTALESWFTVFGNPIAAIVAAGLIVFGTPLFAAWAYFRRKEYETVRHRYLDDGLLKIIQQVEYSLSLFEYNWAHAISILKIYRDLGPESPPDFYKSGYTDIDIAFSFEASRHYLLFDLINDKICFEVHQMLTVFLMESDNLFKSDFGSAIRVSLEGTKSDTQISPPDKIYNSYKEAFAKTHKDSESYYVFLGSLQNLASILSRKHYNFKSLKKFKNETEVINIVKALKERFKEDLSKYANEKVPGSIKENAT